MTDYTRNAEPGGAGTSSSIAAQQATSGGLTMRSPRGLWGSIVLLLALPIAVLTQVMFGSGSAIAIHLALAAGCVLVASSAFDFGTPRWIAWTGCVSAGAFAAIFLAQAASSLLGNESFSYFANEVLGFWPEKVLLSLLTLWLVGMLLTAGRGKTRILGFVAMAVVVCVDAYIYFGLLYLGTNPFLESPIVKLAYLLPFVWLIFESTKGRPKEDSQRPAP
jgi:hypothetical protein